jgi:hypothetical protein
MAQARKQEVDEDEDRRTREEERIWARRRRGELRKEEGKGKEDLCRWHINTRNDTTKVKKPGNIEHRVSIHGNGRMYNKQPHTFVCDSTNKLFYFLQTKRFFCVIFL